MYHHRYQPRSHLVNKNASAFASNNYIALNTAATSDNIASDLLTQQSYHNQPHHHNNNYNTHNNNVNSSNIGSSSGINSQPNPNYGRASLTSQFSEERHDVIFRKVRGILNKITPETFDKLSKELVNVGLDSPRTLRGLIYLLFDKALKDLKYSSLYAKLCQQLSEKSPNFETEPGPNTFCKFLISKCEDEFERRRKATEDFDDKYELSDEEYELKAIAKQKMLGNIKFICELGKKRLLQEEILHECIRGLLSKKKERPIQDQAQDLECLCQIMRTIGSLLDIQASRNLMNQYFERIDMYSKKPELPSRIRFMLRDIIDLRNNNWRPRPFQREDNVPQPLSKLREDASYDMTSGLSIDKMSNNKNLMGMGDISKLHKGKLSSLLIDDEPGFTTTTDYHWGSPLLPHDSPFEAFSSYPSLKGNGPAAKSAQVNAITNNSARSKPVSFGLDNRADSFSNPFRERVNLTQASSDLHMQQRSFNSKRQPSVPRESRIRSRDQHNAFNTNHHADPPRPMAGRVDRDITTQDKISQAAAKPIRPSGDDHTTGPGVARRGIYEPPRHLQHKVDHISALNIHDSTQTKPFPVQNGPVSQPDYKRQGRSNERNHQLSTDEFADNFDTKEKKPNRNNELEFKNFRVSSNRQDKDRPPRSKEIHLPPIPFNRGQNHQLESESNLNWRSNNLIVTTSANKNGLPSKDFSVTNISLRPSHNLVGRAISNPQAPKAVSEERKPKLSEERKPKLSEEQKPQLSEEQKPQISDEQKPQLSEEHKPQFLEEQKRRLSDEQMPKLSDEPKNQVQPNEITDQTADTVSDSLDPMLTIETDLWVQMEERDPSPPAVYRWIKENVDQSIQSSPMFAHVFIACLLRHIHNTAQKAADKFQDTNQQEDEDSPQQSKTPASPSQVIGEIEKNILAKFQQVMHAILKDKQMQLATLYELQAFYSNLNFPKGALLRWFNTLYDLSVIDDDVFFTWKEEINDDYPGKGQALFQVNTWLTWLAEAESEEEEEEEE